MNIRPLEVAGAFVLSPERERDRHGFFSRGFARFELERRGLEPTLMRSDVLVCHELGVVWGPHYQVGPSPESVFLRCTRGAAMAIAFDPEDGTEAASVASVRLDPDERSALYVRGGLAYGFQTLEAETEVFFQASEQARPRQDRSLSMPASWRATAWPLPVTGSLDAEPAGLPG